MAGADVGVVGPGPNNNVMNNSSSGGGGGHNSSSNNTLNRSTNGDGGNGAGGGVRTSGGSTSGTLNQQQQPGAGGVRTPPTTPLKAGGKMLAVKILMLDDTYTLFQIQSKAHGAVLLEQVCRQLNLLESDYFGLEYTDGSTCYWLDLDKPMSRQVCLRLAEPLLRFCVKFYTPDPGQLEEEYTRYLVALQIKRDLAHGSLVCNNTNTAALLASYIVQAECGDYVEEDYPDHRYLSMYKFVPSQDDHLEMKIMESHKKHVGMTPGAADLNLLETARRCDMYGIKMHQAKDHEGVALNLAVAHMGVLVFQNHTKINTFSWAKVRKLSFKRKRFLIKLHPDGYGNYKDVVEFFFDGRNECKNFWKKCVEHHGFFRCMTVKKLPRQKTRVISRGSSFRYSGRTQKQVQDYVRENYVKRQPFQRHTPCVPGVSVGGVNMSRSAQTIVAQTPLLQDNMCVGTPVSLSCGSVTLASTADAPPSPTSTSSPPHLQQQHHHLHHRHLHHSGDTSPPSRQDTLSPSPSSIPCSPDHRQQQQQGQAIRDSLQNLRDHHQHHHHHHHHKQQHLSPLGNSRGDLVGDKVGGSVVVTSDGSEMSEFVVGRVGSRLSIVSKSSAGGGGAGSKRGSLQQQSLSPLNNISPPDTSSGGPSSRHQPPSGGGGSLHSPNLDSMGAGGGGTVVNDVDLMDEDCGDNNMDDLSFHHRYPRYYDELQYGDPEDDSGDNLSHDSYELIEREDVIVGGGSLYSGGEGGGSRGGSLAGSRGPSRTSSRGVLSSLGGDILSSSREGLEWCESKGGGDMPVSRGSSRAGVHTGSLPRSHGGSVSTIINGYTGSLPRAHSVVSQSGQLSRTLAGSRASSRITLELPLDASPDKEEEDLSSPGSPEFHENSVCEITSESGYARHLGTITITDNVSLYTPQLPARRPGLERTESLTESLTMSSAQRSRSNSRSNMNRGGSRENLRDGATTEASMSTMSTRVSASIRAAKEMGQYVDYGSSQESLHKMSSCESDVGSSMSSQTRSSTTPRPSDFHPHVQFLPARRSTSTSPPTITSGSSQPPSQPRPRSMDFSTLHKKPLFHVYSSGRGSDSGGNTDSDICSPLEIPLPVPSTEQVKEVDEEEEEEEEEDVSLTSSHEQVLFLRRPPDIGLITRVRGSSDEEEEEEEEIDDPEFHEPDIGGEEDEDHDELIDEDDEEIMCVQPIVEEDEEIGEMIQEEEESVDDVQVPEVTTRLENDQIVVVIEENLDPFLFNLQALPPHELKEESPSSVEMDFTDTSKDRKVDESEASERTVIERYHLPDDRLNKVGSKDSQMSIEEIDEAIMDRRSSLGLERRPSYHESRKSPYLDRRLSTQDLERISPLPEKDRRPSYQEGERRSPYLEADRADRRSSNQDLSRRSPYERDRTPSNSSDRSRRGSNSSDRRSSVSSDRHGSISSDRRGSASSDHKPSLSDIGRRTSISVENDQRSPFFDTPAFEFDPPVFEFENENVFDSVERDTSPPNAATLPTINLCHSPPNNDTEPSRSYLDQSRINMDELTEALIPPEDSSDTFSSMSGARVVEVVEACSSESTDNHKKDSSPTQSISRNVVSQSSKQTTPQQTPRQSPQQTPKQTSQHVPTTNVQQKIPSPPSSSYEEVVMLQEQPTKKPIRDVIIIKVDVEQTPQEFEGVVMETREKTKRITPKIEDLSGGSSYESNQDSQDKSNNGDVSLEGAVGRAPYHPHQDFYDDEDDHAQMSDHSSQSPDLVSEPDEYHDEYQEPEFYQPYRQIDMGYAFPSRTLSRISERSTTSEQEQEQDHVHSEHENPDNETDSKISTPTEDKQGMDHPSDIPSDVSSDYSNSNCEDAFSESRPHSQSQSLSQTKSQSVSSVQLSTASNDSKNHHYSTPTNGSVSTVGQAAGTSGGGGGPLTAEEQENVNKFATHLFLCDLPEFCAGDDSDEFPSPPSSAFLENPHAELRNIESYYMDIAQKTVNSKMIHEGIYDNIPVKFEGIHEVSESESGSEENHTLQEPEDDLEALEDLKNVKDLDEDPEEVRLTPTPTSPENPPSPPPHAQLMESPPPPPPRAQANLPSGRGSSSNSTSGTSGGGLGSLGLGGSSSLAGVVGTYFGAKSKTKSKSPSPPVSPGVPAQFGDSLVEITLMTAPTTSTSSSVAVGRGVGSRGEILLPELPGSPPSLSSLDSPDSQALSRLPPYLPMLPSTPPSVSSLDSPDSQIFIMQPASPPASFANPESPTYDSTTSESSCRIPGTEGGLSSQHDSVTESTTTFSGTDDNLRRQNEIRQQHLDMVDFGQQPTGHDSSLLELDFSQQKEIADLEMADFEHQQSLTGIELAEFQQQREMANLAIANLTSSHSEMSDFDLSPTSPFDMLDFSELASCTDASIRRSGGGAVGGGSGNSVRGVTALDFEVIGGQLEEDRRRSRGSGGSGGASGSGSSAAHHDSASSDWS